MTAIERALRNLINDVEVNFPEDAEFLTRHAKAVLDPNGQTGTPLPPVQYSPAIRQAFADWNDHRAYLDNGGNYRVREEAATPTHRPNGKIAPWNREVKRLFADSAQFHRAAQEWKDGGKGR